MLNKNCLAACSLSSLAIFAFAMAEMKDANADNPECSSCTEGIDAMEWDTTTSPSTVNAAPVSGAFSFTQVLRWWFSDYRNQGTIVAGSSMNNIDSPVWTPDLFYPDETSDCCTGILTVTTSGALSSTTADGTMSSKAQVVYPLIARTKNVTIHHP